MSDIKTLLAASSALQAFPPAILAHLERIFTALPEEKQKEFVAVLEEEQKEAQKRNEAALLKLKNLEKDLNRLIREAEEKYSQKEEHKAAEKLLTNN